MVNDIIDAISIKLNDVFGNEYEIYSENVEQGLNMPCFFIEHITTNNRKLLAKRKQRIYSFDIHYFTENGREDMLDVSEKMLDELEFITLVNKDIVRGLDMNAQIVDDILHVSVNYNVFLNDLTKDEPMLEEIPTIRLKG